MVLRSFLLGVALLGGAAASLLVVDGINRPPARADLGFARVDTARRSHVLILLVDSWRHETALDSAIMPEVARLSHDGASGKLETVFEGFSIPAIRAEFSGAAETQLVNLVRNFRFRALSTESVFLDASRMGKHTLVVGDEPFTQFGPVLEKQLPVAAGLDIYERDRLRPGIALEAYRSGEYDIVVCHYETADWRAHELGIASPRYAAAFAAVDSIARNFARERRHEDYLFVFGDHGHNETGEHKTGLYIPTHGLFIGPDITRGVAFSSLPVNDVRFLVDHAIGIELRASPSQLVRLSAFLPVQSTAVAGDQVVARTGWSHHLADYLLFAFMAAVFAIAFSAVVGAEPRERLVTWTIGVVVALFVVEMLAQQILNPAWTLFPIAMAVVGVLAWRADRRAAVVIVGFAVFFATRLVVDPAAPSMIRSPNGLGAVVPLYTAGIIAKLLLLAGIGGKRRWAEAAVLTAVLAMLEFRVVDRPFVFLGALVALSASFAMARDPVRRRLALIALGYAIVYFTLRLPIYQYVWVDFFLLSVWLGSRAVPGAWLDACIITGTFALTSGWLPGGLEWSFLYSIFPAYAVELQVGWFVPVILLKLPMLLVLTWWVIGERPSRRFLALMMTYACLRFAAVWIVRLAGGTGAEIWPLAEQGIYLTTFAVAALWVATAWRPRVPA